jgi:hypothetical protein
MAVIFPRWTNLLPLAIAGGVLVAVPTAVLGAWYWFSPEFTDVGYQPEQPVEFSHARHAGELGLDCRYCHNTVERASYAAIPAVQTCMNCHSVIQKAKDATQDSEKLKPLLEAWSKDDEALHWKRVHLLPDFAYFDHSVHVAAGVGCVSCHGRVDEMERVRQEKPLSMAWCLDCHRDPAPNLRPASAVTDMAWDRELAGYDPHADPARSRFPDPPQHCSGCHR